MFDKLTESEKRFLEFINMLGSTALYQMGIIGNPMTGQIEKDLNAARLTIDILAMLKEKTKGNLTEVEQRSLDDMVNHLQMNFVEQSKENKEEAKPEVTSKKEELKPEPPKEADASKNDEDVELNWEKHERKNYGSSEKQ